MPRKPRFVFECMMQLPQWLEEVTGAKEIPLVKDTHHIKYVYDDDAKWPQYLPLEGYEMVTRFVEVTA